MKFLTTIRRKITEQISTGLRVSFGSLRSRFWTSSTISLWRVDPEKTRLLYRNMDSDTNLSAGFIKRIINCVPEFMGLPDSTSGDEIVDDFVNNCIHTYWSAEIQQLVRDACRDSRTFVRFRKPANALISEDERDAGKLEIVPPENCDVYYSQEDATWIERAFITHTVDFLTNEEDMAQGREPQVTTHTIIEEITPKEFRYYDQTAHEELTNWNKSNSWGFVPLVEIFNEYESYLEGGQSDLEPVWPFLRAFHDVMYQTLSAHKYHSIPKAKFKLQDIQQFLLNNFPGSFSADETGNPIPGTFNGSISWQGQEIIFLQPEEDVGFLEAKSVLGDSKTLLAFLLDCIAISAETPKWILMLDVGAADRSETLTFIQRIERKRMMFAPYIQRLAKMSLKAAGMAPALVKLDWDEIDINVLVTETQAMQQAVMSLETASERNIISDRTYRSALRRYVPMMKSPDQEAADAENNLKLTVAAPNTPIAELPPPQRVTNRNGNVRT